MRGATDHPRFGDVQAVEADIHRAGASVNIALIVVMMGNQSALKHRMY
jgi:hypothetical protein